MRSFCQLHEMSESACQSILSYVHSTYALSYSSQRESPLTPVASVHSFDIFDTILARSVAEPEDIFSLVEEQFPCPNFRAVRSYAASLSTGSFDAIYDTMQAITLAEPSYIQALKEFEFSMEVKHSYLLEQNYRRVSDGDILVSDMYLPFDRIWTLLRAAGFNRTVNLFVSPAGKAHGWMWKSLAAVYDIRSHLGDNLHSDVAMAGLHGVRGEHTTLHAFTALEKRFSSHGQSGSALALLLRRMRHRNPFPANSTEAQLFSEQVGTNLPVLLLYAQSVVDLMAREGLQRLLLTMRDCVLLEKVLAAFFPEVQAIPFHTSRIMYRNPTQEFIDYIQRLYIPGSTLLLDFGGAFRSGRQLFSSMFGQLPRVHLLTYGSGWAPPFEGLTFLFDEQDYDAEQIFSGLGLEFLNADMRGSLVDFFERSRFDDGSGFSGEGVKELVLVRPPLNYRIASVRVYHEAVDLFCATADRAHVRRLLRQVAAGEALQGGALSTALMQEAVMESGRTPPYLQLHLHQGIGFLEHLTLKIAFDRTYLGDASSPSSSSSSSKGGAEDSAALWGWYPFLDILAAEWSIRTQADSEQRGERLLLLEQRGDSSFRETAAALSLYWGPLLRRLDWFRPLPAAQNKEEEEEEKDPPFLHSSWVAQGSADSDFKGPAQLDSMGIFAQALAESSVSPEQLFSLVLETVAGCPASWESVLTRHNNLLRLGLLRPGYSYLVRRDGCRIQSERKSESRGVDAQLLRGFAVSCYSCPPRPLLASSEDERGQCRSSLWKMVGPLSSEWTVCSLQAPPL